VVRRALSTHLRIKEFCRASASVRPASRFRAARSSALTGAASGPISIGAKGGTSMGASSSPPSPDKASRRDRVRAIRPLSLRLARRASSSGSAPSSAEARNSTSSTAREAGAPASTGTAAAFLTRGSRVPRTVIACLRTFLDATALSAATKCAPARAKAASSAMNRRTAIRLP